ncbi:hypothetical protein AwMethylo_11120 [Methylobacterium sp.]|nr:hypothetical protein AwMethylo_11120 [Methylobacterium sp.]
MRARRCAPSHIEYGDPLLIHVQEHGTMAHANPEFALARRAHLDGPTAHRLPGPESLAALRARMREIGQLIAIDYPVDPEEREAYRLWRATVRQQRACAARARQLADALAEPVGGMHAGTRRGEVFVPPSVRGTGRVKRWAAS